MLTVGGENMRPRLKPSQRVEFDMAAYTSAAPKAGDIVVLAPPVGAKRNRCRFPRNPGDRLCVKPFGRPEPQIRLITRVVAVGGDRIRFRRGRVERNGRLERRRGIRRCRPNACTYRRAITVPAGHVYVAGDNRPSSDDSRFWGAVPVAQVLGRYVRTLPPA